MGSTAPVKERRILVVEDDADLLRMLAKLMETLGTVLTAVDGEDALSTIQESPPFDLIITDVMMPRMDGLELVRRVRADHKIGRTPIIILTARGRPREVVDGINAGARHYLTKPFKQQELLDKAKRALGHH